MIATFKVIRKAARRCTGLVVKGAPPEPDLLVDKMLKDFHMTKVHLLQMYNVFHYLKQLEDEEEIIVDAVQIEVDSLKKMVVDHRKWVLRLLMRLLALGGCEERVTWDEFLWILLRFSSLNRTELAQALFLFIQGEVASLTVHYLSSDQLKEFYRFYDDCPVKAFSTQGIDFDKMPLTRYYAQDFTELTQRFNQLINPVLYLQRALQSHMPGVEYWDNIDYAPAFVRKISFDFFIMDSSRVHLRGEPPFRESCDMLVPDALGATAINLEQWVLRTSGARSGKGLRQVSVWGEQPAPEVIEAIKRKLEEEAALKAKQEEERKRAEELEAAAKRAAWMLPLPPAVAAPLGKGAAAAGTTQPPPPPPEGAPAGPTEEELAQAGPPREAWAEGAEAKGADRSTKVVPLGAPPPRSPAPGAAAPTVPKKGAAAPTVPKKGAAAPTVPKKGAGEREADAGPAINPAALAIYAATLDEGDMGPFDVLPPSWMNGATVAPAPQLPNWGSPPRPRTFGREARDAFGGDRGVLT